MNSPLVFNSSIIRPGYRIHEPLHEVAPLKGWGLQEQYMAEDIQISPTSETTDIEERVALQDSASREHYSYMNQVAFTILLHLALISVYIALFGVYLKHYEHHIVIQLDETWIPTVVTTLSQLIGTVCKSITGTLNMLDIDIYKTYLALLVLFTQHISLRRDLHSRQTLTAVHDKNNAWLGLASSLTTVFQQCSSRAAPVGVIAITLYLSSIFALHITIPALFDFIPVNGSKLIYRPTRLANISMDTGVTL